MTKRFTNSNFSSAPCGEGICGNIFTVGLENASVNTMARLLSRGLLLSLNLIALNLIALNLINSILLVVLIIVGREVRF